MNYLTWVITVLVPVNLFAQAPEMNDKGYPITSIAIQSTNYIMDASFEAQIENFRKLAPSSSILQYDLKGYAKDINFYDQQSNATNLYITLPVASKKYGYLNPTFRAGFSFMQYGALNYKLSKTDYFRVDTLTSGNGNQYFVDSTSYHHVEMQYRQNQIMLDGALLISSNEQSRWCVKSGLGVGVGFAYNAGTKITYERISDYEQNVPTNYNDRKESEYEEETFANKGGFVSMVYIPFIVDFRIARKGKFFSRSHLYLEFKPFLYYTSIAEIENQVQSGGGGGLGYRYEF